MPANAGPHLVIAKRLRRHSWPRYMAGRAIWLAALYGWPRYIAGRAI
jgi:hypothetical protein